MPSSTSRRTNAVTDEAIAQRRAEILDHTADVIVRSGVAGCTFAAVSEASGHSIGAIQHHFRTRDRLINACIEHRMAESQREWRAIAERDASPLVRLRALLDYTVAGEKEFADAWGFWIEVNAAARRDEDLRAKVNERLALWQELFLEVLTAAMAGRRGPSDPEQLTATLVAMADGLAIQAVNGTYGMHPQRMRDVLHHYAATSLGTELTGEN